MHQTHEMCERNLPLAACICAYIAYSCRLEELMSNVIAWSHATHKWLDAKTHKQTNKQLYNMLFGTCWNVGPLVCMYCASVTQVSFALSFLYSFILCLLLEKKSEQRRIEILNSYAVLYMHCVDDPRRLIKWRWISIFMDLVIGHDWIVFACLQ